MKGKLLISSAIAGLVVLGGTVGTMASEGVTDTVVMEATPVSTANATATPTATATSTATVAPTATKTPSVRLNDKDKAFANELARILGLDPARVEAATAQARQAMVHKAVDATVKAWLDALVKNGRLTQSEADAIYTWLQARPAAADGLLTQLVAKIGDERREDIKAADRGKSSQAPRGLAKGHDKSHERESEVEDKDD